MPMEKSNKILGKEIFAVGEWNGDPYSEQDLKEICTAYNETATLYKPYIKLGHAENQNMLQNEGLPAAGWIENLRVAGKKLICDIVDIPDKVYKLLQNNAYRYVSPEIFWDINILGKKYKRMLSGVALLGAEMPACITLNDFANLYNLDAKVIKKYTIENKERDFMPETKNVPAKENEKPVEKKPEAPAPEQKPVVPPAAPAPEQKPEVKKMEMGEGDEMEKRVADLEAKIAALMQQLTAKDSEVAKYKQDAEKADLEKFLTEIKIAPAAKDYAVALLGETKKEYSINDKKVSKQDLLKEIIKVYSTSAVNLDQNSTTGGNKTEVDLEDQKVNEIKKYAADNKISFREAMISLSADKSDESDVDENEEE
jgi:hypothetical protein